MDRRQVVPNPRLKRYSFQEKGHDLLVTQDDKSSQWEQHINTLDIDLIILFLPILPLVVPTTPIDSMTSLGNNRETAVAVVLGAAVAGSATLLSLYLSKVGRIQWCIKRRMPHSVMLLCLHRVLIVFPSFIHCE